MSVSESPCVGCVKPTRCRSLATSSSYAASISGNDKQSELPWMAPQLSARVTLSVAPVLTRSVSCCSLSRSPMSRKRS